MAFLEPYLTNSAQGKLVLSGSKVDFALKNNVSSPDFPAKITTSDVIGSTDFLGWENPVVSIVGTFDEFSTPKVSTFKAFAKETTSVLIYDPVFFTAGTQLIQILDLSFSRDADGNVSDTGSDQVKGTWVGYQLNAILTE